MKTILSIPLHIYKKLQNHLISNESKVEEVAFIFASVIRGINNLKFEYKEWFAVQPDSFLTQSPYYFELTDEMKATIIKKAHDLGTSVVELHSHLYPYLACFSPSDWSGFEEFVPHIWWRLNGRPYVAVVVTPTSFDALVWLNNPQEPSLLDELRVGSRRLYPTNRSLSERSRYNDIWKI